MESLNSSMEELVNNYSITALEPINTPKNNEFKEGLPKTSKLTFGVEFEFSIATLDWKQTDPHPEDGRVVYGVNYITKIVDGKEVHTHEEQSTTLSMGERWDKPLSDHDSGFSEEITDHWDTSSLSSGWDYSEKQETPEQHVCRTEQAVPGETVAVQTTWSETFDGLFNRDRLLLSSRWHLQSHIANTLRKAGFPVITRADLLDNVDLPDKSHEYWTVTEDGSISAHRDLEAKYQCYGIEITSPAYEFSQESLELVKEVCNLLTSTYRINCNESCGLHVHVGNGSNGFEDEVVKNLFATLWAFEPHLDAIHPAHRLSNNTYCYNLRTESDIAQNIAEYNLRLEDGLHILLHALSIEEVARLQETPQAHSKSAYRTTYLIRPYEHEYKRTMEFRQHESTLGPDRVAHWVQFCVGLVTFAGKTPKAELENLLKGSFELGANFTLESVLNSLGMPNQGLFYRRRLEQSGAKVGDSESVFESASQKKSWAEIL